MFKVNYLDDIVPQVNCSDDTVPLLCPDAQRSAQAESVTSVYERHVLRKLSGHQKPIISCLKINDERVMTSSGDGTVRVWDLKGHEPPTILRIKQGCLLWAQLHDGRILSSTPCRKQLHWWSIEPFELQKSYGTFGAVSAAIELTVFPNSVAYGTEMGKIVILNYERGCALKVIDQAHKGPINCLYQLSGHQLLSSARDDKTIHWDMNDFTQLSKKGG